MTAKRSRDAGVKVLATNRAASYQYHLLRRMEAGVVLNGPEVKSIREGRINLKEAYVRIQGGEVFLVGAHVSPYAHAGSDRPDPVRTRKLLLHAAEIRKLAKESSASGMTLVPTRVYLKSGRIKVEIAVARGKKTFDKREAIRRRESDREMARARR